MFTMNVDASDLSRGMSRAQKQHVPTAAMWALNDAAADALEHIQDRMKVVFDDPTPWALNAFMVWRATKSTMLAEVKERPSVGKRHFLKIQEAGGVRPQTGLETLMSAKLAYDGQIHGVIPTRDAKRVSYGKWSAGERNQVLSAVQSQRDAHSNSTAASKAKRKSRVGYFVPRSGSSLSAGVWKRDAKRNLTKILNFTTAMPKYDPRLGFYDGAEEVFEKRFPIHFERTFQKVMARS